MKYKDHILKLLSITYVRYLIAGGLAFAADYTTLLTFKYLLDFSTEVSASAGYIVGLLISFTVNRQWAFIEGRQRLPAVQFIEYSILVLFNYVFTVGILSWLDDTIPVTILKPAVVALITVWNFAIYRYVIFRKKREEN